MPGNAENVYWEKIENNLQELFVTHVGMYAEITNVQLQAWCLDKEVCCLVLHLQITLTMYLLWENRTMLIR